MVSAVPRNRGWELYRAACPHRPFFACGSQVCCAPSPLPHATRRRVRHLHLLQVSGRAEEGRRNVGSPLVAAGCALPMCRHSAAAVPTISTPCLHAPKHCCSCGADLGQQLCNTSNAVPLQRVQKGSRRWLTLCPASLSAALLRRRFANNDQLKAFQQCQSKQSLYVNQVVNKGYKQVGAVHLWVLHVCGCCALVGAARSRATRHAGASQTPRAWQRECAATALQACVLPHVPQRAVLKQASAKHDPVPNPPPIPYCPSCRS